MPRSPVIKGSAGPILVGTRVFNDPATGDKGIEWEYAGSMQAISGMANNPSFKTRNVDIRVEDGMGRAFIRSANGNTGFGEITYRYEIGVEVLEQEIWSHPSVIEQALRWDANLTDGMDSFRQLVEDEVNNKSTIVLTDAAMIAVFNTVVSLLRDGVSGWEKEYTVMRRMRRIPSYFVSTPGNLVANIGSTSLIYSTAQLGLPTGISFALPDSTALAPASSSYQWGWRRRPSQVIFDGEWIEQSGEFILAEWATLFYTAATDVASW